MMPFYVFRVQDESGRGPFKPGFSKQWADEDFSDGVIALPTWMEEFGPDLIQKVGRDGEYYGSAVRDTSQIAKWFSSSEQRRLDDLGYSIVGMRIGRILAESVNQLVFARVLPLNRNVMVFPWQHRLTRIL